MPDMLNVSISGLRAFQRALETTSHNIANVATPGYSRQAVLLGTRPPETFGSAALGTGVYLQDVRRVSDDLLALQMRQATSSLSRVSAYAEKAGALSNLFSDSSTGLSAALQKFNNALQEVANTPSSTSARQVLLSEAGNVATRLKTYEARLSALDAQIDEQLRAEATMVSGIARNIADLNQQIMRASSQTGSAPPDLLDARDRQLAQLAERLDTTIVRQNDGSINVFVGNGQPLVLGNVASELVAQPDAFQPGRVTLAFRNAGGTVDISSSLNGGSIGGLLDARRELLDPARNELGRIAVGLAEAINAQHRRGMDLYGSFGGDLFSIGAVGVSGARTNGGNATATVTRTDVGALTGYDYILRYESGSWTVRRADTGAAVSFNVSGGGALEFDGLSVAISGTPADGDQFLVRPTALAIDGFNTLISDPSRIAAAAPVRTAQAAGNAGTATISAGEVLNPGDPDLLTTVTIRFTDANTWEARDAANNLIGGAAYVPGGNIQFNGWQVSIDGEPAAGDSFTVTANTGGVGDNRNALALAGTLDRGLLSGGTESLHAAASRFVGQVGVAAASANTSLEAQQIIHEESVAAVDALSGVNLDEEAANMLRFQQAYQAAAQMIRVTQELMDTLMNAVRR
jgi:flagellar hook-associated protein 1 FlgK